jgi:WD40 repeat protein
LEVLRGHAHAIWGLGAAAKSGKVASTDLSGRLILWDVRRPHRLVRHYDFLTHSSGINALKYCGEGGNVAVGEGNGVLAIFSETQRPRNLLLPGAHAIMGVACSHGGRIAAVDFSGRVTVSDPPYAKVCTFTVLGGPPYDVSISDDGERLAVGSESVQVFTASSAWPPGVHRIAEFASMEPMTLSADGKQVAMYDSDDDEVVAYRVATKERLWTLKLASDDDRPVSMEFDRDGNHLIAGMASDQAVVFDTRSHTGTRLSDFPEVVLSVAFNPDATRFATSSGGSVIVWDAKTLRPIGGPLAVASDGIFGVSFSSDGKTLVSGDRAGRLLYWTLDKDAWVRIACSTVGRDLTQDEVRTLAGDSLLFRLGLYRATATCGPQFFLDKGRAL